MVMKTFKKQGMAEEIAILTVAVLIISASVFFFLIPSHCSVSSITGLAIVLHGVTAWSVAFWTLLLNGVLLIIGFFTCGKEFGAKTVYTSIILPFFLWMFSKLLPNYTSLTGSQELDVVCHCIVCSIGLSILFTRNASSGGLDIVAKILNKYFRVDLGKAMTMSGLVVACSSLFVFDTKTMILSLLGTWLQGLILDKFIFGRNLKRSVCIITNKETELREFVLSELKSGATLFEIYGAYSMEKRNQMQVNVTKAEYQKLMTYLETKDPNAFVTVYTVTDARYLPKKI